jgi:hypothetical protein
MVYTPSLANLPAFLALEIFFYQPSINDNDIDFNPFMFAKPLFQLRPNHSVSTTP